MGRVFGRQRERRRGMGAYVYVMDPSGTGMNVVWQDDYPGQTDNEPEHMSPSPTQPGWVYDRNRHTYIPAPGVNVAAVSPSYVITASGTPAAYGTTAYVEAMGQQLVEAYKQSPSPAASSSSATPGSLPPDPPAGEYSVTPPTLIQRIRNEEPAQPVPGGNMATTTSGVKMVKGSLTIVTPAGQRLTFRSISPALDRALQQNGRPLDANGGPLRVDTIQGGWVIQGTPLNVIFGKGWLPGQKDILAPMVSNGAIPKSPLWDDAGNGSTVSNFIKWGAIGFLAKKVLGF